MYSKNHYIRYAKIDVSKYLVYTTNNARSLCVCMHYTYLRAIFMNQSTTAAQLYDVSDEPHCVYHTINKRNQNPIIRNAFSNNTQLFSLVLFFFQHRSQVLCWGLGFFCVFYNGDISPIHTSYTLVLGHIIKSHILTFL